MLLEILFWVFSIILLLLVIRLLWSVWKGDPEVRNAGPVELKEINNRRSATNKQWFRQTYITNPLAILLVGFYTYYVSKDRFETILFNKDIEINSKNDTIQIANDSISRLKNTVESLNTATDTLNNLLTNTRDALIVTQKELTLAKDSLFLIEVELQHKGNEVLQLRHYQDSTAKSNNLHAIGIRILDNLVERLYEMRSLYPSLMDEDSLVRVSELDKVLTDEPTNPVKQYLNWAINFQQFFPNHRNFTSVREIGNNLEILIELWAVGNNNLNIINQIISLAPMIQEELYIELRKDPPH